MVRTLSLTAGDAEAVASDISITRDEPYVVEVVDKPDVEMTLTIAALPGDDPLVEIPGVGSFGVLPTLVQSLTEGKTYKYNIWQDDVPMLLFSGDLEIRNSIAPSGADFSTIFLNGVGDGSIQSVIHLTQSQYDALAAPDPATLYIVTEV
ncbi:hypothetical protein [Celeribacter halophilus]|uniref:phage upper tail fiber protein n=1 Tax=Celeribacter halophilus TaxID=576117 RepID=UPI003A935F9E